MARSKNDVQEVTETAVVPQTKYTDAQLRDGRFADFYRDAISRGELITAEDALGNGFTLIKDKDKLLGVSFLALEWRFNASDKFGEGEFVSIYCITEDDKKYVINDSGVGICKKLRELSDRTGQYGPMFVAQGLTVSRDYATTDSNGNTIMGTTYYIG